MAGIVLVLVCVVIWMSEKSVNGDWGASGLSLADRLHVPGPRERFMSQMCIRDRAHSAQGGNVVDHGALDEVHDQHVVGTEVRIRARAFHSRLIVCLLYTSRCV